MLILVTVVCVALAATMPAVSEAQYRPSYFPRPGGFSQTLPQYGGGGGAAGGDTDLGNRDSNPANALPAPGSASAVEDTQLANRVQEWPQAVQPFWFLNQQAIAQHVGQRVPCQGPGCPGTLVGPAPQASFIGSGVRGSR